MKSFPYPYPVLGNGNDIIDGGFIPEVIIESNFDATIITCVQLTTKNQYFNNLVAENRAQYLVEIKCSNTFFRKTYSTVENQIKIELNANDLREKVEIRFYICATDDIVDYCPDNMNEDFDDLSFHIERGDIIGLTNTISFPIEKEFDPLNAPMSSIIKIEEQQGVESGLAVNYENDKIIIQLSEPDFKLYQLIKSASAEALHSAVVLPVLIDVIYELNSGENDYSNYAWSYKLKSICESKNIKLDNPLKAAQKILNNPVQRVLKWRKKEVIKE